MTVEIRDILLKAAEDVSSGMWCKGVMFSDLEVALQKPPLLNMKRALQSHRCAAGSIAIATQLLGGDFEDYWAALTAPEKHLPDSCHSVADHNDQCLPDDPFEAGQQLAELFRQTAEAL